MSVCVPLKKDASEKTELFDLAGGGGEDRGVVLATRGKKAAVACDWTIPSECMSVSKGSG